MQAGDILSNPATGTRIVWRRTAAETGGLASVAEVHLAPTGRRAPLHVHPRQRQRIEVLAGSLGAQLGRRRSVVGSGARFAVPEGLPHRFWNAGEDTVQLVVEVTPSLGTEALLEALYALSDAGKSDRGGLAHLLRVAALVDDHFDTVRLAFPPTPLQRIVLLLAGPLGRRV